MWDTVGAWRLPRRDFPRHHEVLDRSGPRAWSQACGSNRSRRSAQSRRRAVAYRSLLTRTARGWWNRAGTTLDLSTSAVKHLDEVVDFLAGDFGHRVSEDDTQHQVGRDEPGHVSARGLLAHNRRSLTGWMGSFDRYPSLTLENCASGGMRTDYAVAVAAFSSSRPSDQQTSCATGDIAAAARPRSR